MHCSEFYTVEIFFIFSYSFMKKKNWSLELNFTRIAITKSKGNPQINKIKEKYNQINFNLRLNFLLICIINF